MAIERSMGKTLSLAEKTLKYLWSICGVYKKEKFNSVLEDTLPQNG